MTFTDIHYDARQETTFSYQKQQQFMFSNLIRERKSCNFCNTQHSRVDNKKKLFPCHIMLHNEIAAHLNKI